jgi:hypothetical protein
MCAALERAIGRRADGKPWLTDSHCDLHDPDDEDDRGVGLLVLDVVVHLRGWKLWDCACGDNLPASLLAALDLPHGSTPDHVADAVQGLLCAPTPGMTVEEASRQETITLEVANDVKAMRSVQ